MTRRTVPAGPFALTGAVRPGPGQAVRPVEAYRIEKFREPHSRKRIPLLAASVSAEHLFDVFLDLFQPLGETVNVVLETSHGCAEDRHEDLTRSDVDLPVLSSYLCDFENLLLNDGCTGVAVLSQDRPMEVQLDEHKLIYVYAYDLKPFRRILRRHGVLRMDEMRLIAEAEHVHHSTEAFEREFQEFACRLGAEPHGTVLTDDSGWLEA